MVIAVGLHILAAVIWVGGMFFAHMALRPSLAGLEPPSRLTLMNAVLGRFFAWVWAAVIILPVSGYIQIFMIDGDLSATSLHVHIMQGIGWVMIVLFFGLYALPYQRFRDAVAAEDWPAAGGHMAPIRRIVGINLLLGLITVVVGSTGRFWG